MNTILTITDFIGRFHPVLVHLPIGILLLAIIFHFLSYKKKFETLQHAVKYSLLLGMFAAIASCISGFLLSSSGDYEEALVDKHQWFGIGVAVAAIVAYILVVKSSSFIKWMMPLLALLIIITGHLGGSITHGEDYLTKSFSERNDKGTMITKPIPNVQEAVAYNDIIQPLLQARCYNCHGPNKQKGKLRLDEQSFIEKGGEDGKVIIAGSAGESELIKRILLPADNKDHMPPKEKAQLTKEQIELLNWWVNSGADFHKKVTELKQPEKIKPYLIALQSGGQKTVAAITSIPEAVIEKAPDAVIEKLKALDVAISPVSQNSNYLMVNFVSVDTVTSKHLELMKQVSKQIIWLKVGNTEINTAALTVIGNLPALTRLFLNNTNVSDNDLLSFKNLSQLQYLNLSQTRVTVNGLNNLNGLKNLQQLYLYQSGITPADFTVLQKAFPKTVIDTGGYQLAFFPTDTIQVKPNPQKIK